MAMSAKMMSDTMVMSVAAVEIKFVGCECCGLTEECTLAYIERIRERYNGKWICGLCAEAVKDEILRSERLISTEEALAIHISFCKKFSTSGPPLNPTVHLISAVRQILRRTFDSAPVNRGPALTRSSSCFPALSGP